ncbi:MAG: WYL domain-containing protein, partial [Acidimicrobiales bacterium]
MEEAVRRSVVVNLAYVDQNGVTTERSVEAVGFYHGGDNWYLIGWCLLRN